jgi:hypothetical protein
MANPFDNQLLLQYLAGAGQDIGSGNPLGTNVNAITQQNIQSRNFMKLLQRMLGGKDIPEGGKVEYDSEGAKIKVPKTAMEDFDPMGRGSTDTGTDPMRKTTYSTQVGGTPNTDSATVLAALLGGQNPSSSPLGISGADLAGLTPQNISQALQFKFGQEAQQRQGVNDTISNIYKLALTQKALTPGAPPKPTAAIQNYGFYVQQQKALGKTPKAFDSWDKDLRTGLQKDYDRYKSEGGELGFQEWYRDVKALSGGIDLEEYTKRRQASADVSAKASVTDPGLVADIEKTLPSEDVYFEHRDRVNSLTEKYGISVENASDIVRKALVRQELDNRIKQAYRGNEVTYEKGKGWFVNGRLVRKDPYGTK